MEELKVFDNQTIIDVICNGIGNLDYLYQCMIINNLQSIDNILDININIKYDKSFVKNINKNLYKKSNTIEKKTYDNQSTFDIYLQFNNNLDGFYDFLRLNNITYNHDFNLNNVIIKDEYYTSSNNLIYSTMIKEVFIETYYLKYEDNTYIKYEDDYKIIIN